MDIEKLVELATKKILERLNAGGAKVVTFGEVPEGLISGAECKAGKTRADIEGCDYIVMSAEAFYKIHSAKPEEKPFAANFEPAAAVAQSVPAQKSIDLLGKRLISERNLREANAVRGDIIRVSKTAIITALAHDYAKSIGARLEKE